MNQAIINLYDQFTHRIISRRIFLDRLTAMVGSAAAASALLVTLQNDYAHAETVPESDPRLASETIAIPGGPAGLSGYLARPTAAPKTGGVLVIHENRGLNPHIRDVTRRLAIAGFVSLGLDVLSPLGGTPANEEQASAMIQGLKREDILASTRAAVTLLHARPDTDGKVGAVGFCWGGGQVNQLAVAEPLLNAGVAYYGMQPSADQVPNIRAALLLHYGGLDERVDAGIPAFESALKANGKDYQIFVYEGANHAFNNDTNAARYDKTAADLAWSRTLAFLRDKLAA
jgi:carboxymethylenebutenolidase